MTLDGELLKLDLEALRLRLMRHQVERPLMADPGFPAWLEIKETIKAHLEAKAGEQLIAWHDAPGPARSTVPPATGAQAPAPVAPSETQEPTMVSKKTSELTPEQLEDRRAYQRKWRAEHKDKQSNRATKPVKDAPKAKAAKKPAKSPMPRPEPPSPRASGLDRPLEAAIDLGRAIERHVAAPTKLEDVRTHLRGIRRQVWSLLADLENLTADQLRELERELELLDAAAHTACQMVDRLAVAG